MRFFFPNLTRPKKAAKHLAAIFPSVHLAKAQQAVANACGYRDWHELDVGHTTNPPSPLDHELTEEGFRANAIRICRALSSSLGVSDGDIQAVLPVLRLTGDRAITQDDHHAIRIACWRAGPMPWQGPRQPGCTFLVKEKGCKPIRAYWRPSEGAVRLVSDRHTNSACATFEAVCPRTPVEDFVPLRLWLPYGWWVLEDGSEVLFSRDYMPLWKIGRDGSVERMPPSLWISGIKQQHWFAGKYDKVSWYSGPARQDAEAKLSAHEITALPKLVDALPLLVADGRRQIDEIAKHLDGTEFADVA